MFIPKGKQQRAQASRSKPGQVPNQTWTRRCNEMHELAAYTARIHHFFLLRGDSVRPQLPTEHYLDYGNDRSNCWGERIIDTHTHNILLPINARHLRCSKASNVDEKMCESATDGLSFILCCCLPQSQLLLHTKYSECKPNISLIGRMAR